MDVFLSALNVLWLKNGYQMYMYMYMYHSIAHVCVHVYICFIAYCIIYNKCTLYFGMKGIYSKVLTSMTEKSHSLCS